MKRWPNVKSGQVGVGSIAQFTWKVDQHQYYVIKLESVRTLPKITYLTSRKSYLVIICPNSYDKLTKSKLGQDGVSSFNPLEAISANYLPQFTENWPKVKLDQVGVNSNFAQNHSLAHRKSYLLIICPNSQCYRATMFFVQFIYYIFLQCAFCMYVCICAWISELLFINSNICKSYTCTDVNKVICIPYL